MRRPADLEATTQLSIGDKGSFEGKDFTLIGRRVVQGVRGQIWNEWVVASDHDPPIVLAESWGSFTVFREGSLLPELERLRVGAPVAIPWIVVERGTATPLASFGEVAAPDGSSYAYADLARVGTTAERGSIAEGTTFTGQAIDVRALGLSPREALPSLIPTPDVSAPSGIELWLDVGDVGTLDGVEYRVLGITARRAAATEEDDEASWEDYLVHNARVGFRWLSVADGHWSYASSIDVGPLAADPGLGLPPQIDLASALFAEAVGGRPTQLVWTAGALPWSAEIGETVMVSDRGDVVIEWTFEDLSAARVQELEPDAIARAFNKRSLPRPR